MASSAAPQSAGTFTFTVTATDNSKPSLTGSLKYSLTVNPALAISPTVLPTATVGNLFSVQLTATGGSGKNYTFTASGLPSWLTLSTTGLLSGTPATTVGLPLKFTVTVSDSNSSASRQELHTGSRSGPGDQPQHASRAHGGEQIQHATYRDGRFR